MMQLDGIDRKMRMAKSIRLIYSKRRYELCPYLLLKRTGIDLLYFLQVVVHCRFVAKPSLFLEVFAGTGRSKRVK